MCVIATQWSGYWNLKSLNFMQVSVFRNTVHNLFADYILLTFKNVICLIKHLHIADPYATHLYSYTLTTN